MQQEDWLPSAELRTAANHAQDALNQLGRLLLKESGFSDREAPAGFPPRQRAGESADEYLLRTHNEIRYAFSDVCSVRRSHVYCYQCNTTTCVHGPLQGEGAVFAGYDTMGRPNWEPLYAFLTTQDDRRVDQLFANRPPILARVCGRKTLIQRQLSSFGRGSMTYHLHGQVVGGYFRVDGKNHALTFQIVETADRRIQGQLLCSEALYAALVEADERKNVRLARVDDTLKGAMRELESLNPAWKRADSRGDRAKLRQQAFRVLRNLEQSMEQKGRQFQRRTEHAEERGRDFRPIHKAQEDLRLAKRENVYSDTVRNSVVVTGKGGRVHVYSPDGRHITSLVLAGDKLDRHRSRGRYVPVDQESYQAFRNAVKAIAEDALPTS